MCVGFVVCSRLFMNENSFFGEIFMKFDKKKIILVLFIGFLMTFSIPIKAGNPFKDEISTVNGFPTWDSDMVNIEEVTETGQNVYIAVLDTGLAPNPFWGYCTLAVCTPNHMGIRLDQLGHAKIEMTRRYA